MKGMILRWLVLTAAILSAAYLIDGIEVRGFGSALLTGAVVGFLNVFFRPVLILLTLPINILTLGLFTFVINGLMLMMASGLIAGFTVHGLWPAVLGSLVVSLVSWVLYGLLQPRGGSTKAHIELRKGRGGRWE